jgi:hypothetical protein
MPGPGSPQPQPSEHAGWCSCPVLAAARVVGELAETGILVSGYYTAAEPYVIAALRERHGCRKGQAGVTGCYWASAVRSAGVLKWDERIPDIRPRTPGAHGSGEYL